MEIYLIRHTTPCLGHDICYGQSDIALADSFPEEWQTLRSKLPEHFDAIYSSPLKRCQLLAERLNGTKIQYDERLLELNFGEWEMKGWNEINQDGLKVWMDNFVEQKTPGGESFRALWVRVTAFLKDLEKTSFDTIALVTHAGVIRTIIAHILGMPLQNAFQLKLDCGGVSLIILRENTYNLAYMNK